MTSFSITPSLFCPHHRYNTPVTTSRNPPPVSTPPSAVKVLPNDSTRKQGIYTTLPTPFATPEFHNLASLRHSPSESTASTSPEPPSSLSAQHLSTSIPLQRPVHFRASTLPNLEGDEIPNGNEQDRARTAVEVTVLGLKKEVRSGGPAEGVRVERFTSPKSEGRLPGANVVESKEHFVNQLVCACVLAIESIWGPSPAPNPLEANVLPLHWFVKEVLRRSRTSCSTLQVALYYLHQIRSQIRQTVTTAALNRDEFIELETILRLEQTKLVAEASPDYPSPPSSPTLVENRYAELLETQNSAVLCGRRMFLAALISSSKYLQDRNYSNRAWAKISGLPAGEINMNERMFLSMIDYQLYVSAGAFQSWIVRLAALATPGQLSSPLASPSRSATIPLPPVHDHRHHTISKPHPRYHPESSVATNSFSTAPNGRRRIASVSSRTTPLHHLSTDHSTTSNMTRVIKSIPQRRLARSVSLSSSSSSSTSTSTSTSTSDEITSCRMEEMTDSSSSASIACDDTLVQAAH